MKDIVDVKFVEKDSSFGRSEWSNKELQIETNIPELDNYMLKMTTMVKGQTIKVSLDLAHSFVRSNGNGIFEFHSRSLEDSYVEVRCSTEERAQDWIYVLEGVILVANKRSQWFVKPRYENASVVSNDDSTIESTIDSVRPQNYPVESPSGDHTFNKDKPSSSLDSDFKSDNCKAKNVVQSTTIVNATENCNPLTQTTAVTASHVVSLKNGVKRGPPIAYCSLQSLATNTNVVNLKKRDRMFW